FIIIIFIIITNCSGNKVSNYHGTKSLDTKFKQLKINVTNKNDLLNILGPPSTISDFNKNKWIYVERIKTNQSLIKLGAQKIKTNNILIVEINDTGLLRNKKILDLNDMNDLKYLKTTTSKEFTKSETMLYGVFSSLREKINAPLRNRNK
ncbi:outer membrane protein assembly factor BamE, partial [Candidatus Pelagibacter sp.]|nr:outer membrane protein assembly factor BamE [Candidatus Pelagibacter sp.]